MSKHTPGEWQKGEAGWCNIVSFDGFDIIGIAKVPNPFNMNLIAAAPDLLEAAKKVCEAYEEVPIRYRFAIMDELESAIVKAEGKEGA